MFDRIDAQKLHGALENAKTLGTMEVHVYTSTIYTLHLQLLFLFQCCHIISQCLQYGVAQQLSVGTGGLE